MPLSWQPLAPYAEGRHIQMQEHREGRNKTGAVLWPALTKVGMLRLLSHLGTIAYLTISAGRSS